MDTSRSYLEPSSFSKKIAAAIIIVYAVITLIPISWMVMTSFKNVDSAISSFKPPIFWKDKSIIREQIKTWSYDQIKKLIIKTNEIEYQAKKNPLISLYIITNFIMEQLKSSNNSPLSRQ